MQCEADYGDYYGDYDDTYTHQGNVRASTPASQITKLGVPLPPAVKTAINKAISDTAGVGSDSSFVNVGKTIRSLR